jgi:RimJ/RimL family protein N-acetyltransferase
VKLEDDAIVLRPFTQEDVPELVAALADPEISRWTRIPFPYTEETRENSCAQRARRPSP